MCCDGDDQGVLQRAHCSALAYLVARFRSSSADRAGRFIVQSTDLTAKRETERYEQQAELLRFLWF